MFAVFILILCLFMHVLCVGFCVLLCLCYLFYAFIVWFTVSWCLFNFMGYLHFNVFCCVCTFDMFVFVFVFIVWRDCIAMMRFSCCMLCLSCGFCIYSYLCWSMKHGDISRSLRKKIVYRWRTSRCQYLHYVSIKSRTGC